MDMYDSNTGDMFQDTYAAARAEPDKMDYNRPPLAIARVVFQPKITKVYKADAALRRGTLFPELDKPFLGKRGAC